MRTISTLYLIFAFAFCFAQEVEVKNELLWEISGNGLKEKSYLYGSLHSNDKRLFRFADSVYVALDNSKAVVLETDIFSLFGKLDTRRNESTLLYDNMGNPYTGSDRASKTVYGDEDGMPQFLDAYFQEYCYNSEKQFYALETVESQMGMFNGIVRSDVNHLGFLAAEVVQERLIELYLKGDISGLDRVMKVNLSAYEGAYQKLIIDRNVEMLKGIDSLLKQGSSFCAVGAGHLSGDNGLINLLRKKGYKVRNVQAVYSEQVFSEKANVRSKRSYTVEDKEANLIIMFPGKPLETSDDLGRKLIYSEFGQGNTYEVRIVPNDPELTLYDQANIHIASPGAAPFKCRIQDDETEICEGISDAYPEGVHWVRIMQNDNYLIVMKAYGGNKFMNSNRPSNFFNKVWFEY